MNSKSSKLLIVYGLFVLLINPLLAPSAIAKKTSSPSISSGFANKWLLSIGINDFQEKEMNRSIKLEQAAKKFSKVLKKDFGFDESQSLIITNSEASRDAILSVSGNGWLGKLATKDDLAVIFLNTYCYPSTDGKTYLCPYDTDFDNFKVSSISAQELLNNIKNSVKCKSIVVVFQTLFTGAPEIVSGLRAKFGQYNLKVDKAKLPNNMIVISSSDFNQPTWGTYFSDSLLDVLSNSDKDSKLSYLFKQAHDSTVTSTIKSCKGCKIQCPVIYFAREPKDLVIGHEPTALNSFRKSDQVIAVEDAISLCGKARSYMDYGKSRKALDHLNNPKNYRSNKFLSDESSLPMVNFLKGKIYAKRGEWSQSVTFLKRAVLKNPNSSIYNSELANSLYETKGDSLSYWRKAYTLDKKNVEAILGLADSQSDKKSARHSVRMLKTALKEFPAYAQLHESLSFAYSKVGKIDDAIRHAQEAVFLDDSSWSSYMNLGALLLMKKSNNEAQAAFRQALDLKPDSSDGYYMLAGALEKTSDPDGALQALKYFVRVSDKEDKRIALAKKRIKELEKKRVSN